MKGLKSPLVWHPVLFAVWPVVSLYGENVAEVPLRQAVVAAVAVAAVTLCVLVVATVMLRDARRASLLTSVLVLTIMLWGTAADTAADATWLLWVWVAGAAILSLAALRMRSALTELNQIAAGIAAVVLVLALVPVVQTKAPILAAANGSPAPAEDIDGRVGEWAAGGKPRDIYYLVFDRYGAQKAMEQRWDMDLGPFFASLRERGFFVAGDSKANHLRSAQSLASMLNLRYLTEMEHTFGPDTNDLLPVYSLLQDHAVGRILQDRGYRYAHIGSWWDPTQANSTADVNYSYDTALDFNVALRRSTLIEAFAGGPQGPSRWERARRVAFNGAQQQFADILRAADEPGPTFTFAHVLLPHEPFVFDRHGNYVSREQESSWTRERSYAEQTLYTNDRIMEVVDELLDVPVEDQPIVILAADEGPAPVRFKADDENFDWTTATAAELEEKFAILNAYYLPGAQDPGLYPSISPVNSWRVIFNTYFGADLELLDDRSYVFRNEHHVYDFTEVTDRLGGTIP